MEALTDKAQAECLYLARRTLHAFVRGHSEGPPYSPSEPQMLEPRGAFVTLKMRGELRGCIGYIQAMEPLWQTLEECTVSAASRDPRFPPVHPSELPDIRMEISVLSPIRPLVDPSTIEVGRHGLIVSRGPRRGLLLPQVATEYGWDRETFLRHTCLKAGLPSDAWSQEGTVLECFTAEVFGEEE